MRTFPLLPGLLGYFFDLGTFRSCEAGVFYWSIQAHERLEPEVSGAGFKALKTQKSKTSRFNFEGSPQAIAKVFRDIYETG